MGRILGLIKAVFAKLDCFENVRNIAFLLIALVLISCSQEKKVENDFEKGKGDINEKIRHEADSLGLKTYLDVRSGLLYKVIEFDSIQWFVSDLHHNIMDSSLFYSGAYEFYGNEAVNACPDGWYLPSYADWVVFSKHQDRLKNTDSRGYLDIKNNSYWTSSLHGTGTLYVPGLISVINFKSKSMSNNKSLHKVLCTRSLKKKDELDSSKNTFYGVLNPDADVPCAFGRIYLNFSNDSLYRCGEKSISLNRRIVQEKDTVDIAIDSTLLSLDLLPNCTAGLERHVYRIAHGMKLYRCENFGWNMLGYSKLKMSETFFVDPRDNRRYRVVSFDSVKWIAENLNYRTPKSLCYDNKNKNCNKFGRLYPESEAENICPDGWKLPSNLDWTSLYLSLEGLSGEKKKRAGFGALSGLFENGRFVGMNSEMVWFMALGENQKHERLSAYAYDGEIFHHKVKRADGSMFYIRCVQKENK